MKKNTRRREFLKNTLLTGLGASIVPIKTVIPAPPAATSTDKATAKATVTDTDNSGTLTFLQTTDIHCQIHPHDELFWENEQIVFRKTAGYAQLAGLFETVRAQNPNTFIVDTGDMFQGSELSVKTTGKAIVPILNALSYDLYLPGN